MTHLDEGQLLAARDDESRHEHLTGCGLCRQSLDELRSPVPSIVREAGLEILKLPDQSFSER